ncbi:hypothetical protein INT47_001409 [Mucor saturninus]|uniref:Yippee domain-containing protein n=1 Tax=Mucor saturninus TaxID=64648 RepID=A0A8H7UWK3_9FUNG|nr:hypothetical protein INT47_001409 [Mucor saturninus]
MGFAYRVYLDNESKCKIYACSKCKTHLSTKNLRISKDFRGMYGKASLFEEVVNIKVAKKTEENIALAIFPVSVAEAVLVGNMQIKAYEESQKYKEGRFILEQTNVEAIEGPPETCKM